MTNDHHIAAGFFQGLSYWSNLVFRSETFPLDNTIASGNSRREQFRGLLCAGFVTVPNGIEPELQRA